MKMDEGERKDRKRKKGGIDAENGHVVCVSLYHSILHFAALLYLSLFLNVMLLAGMEWK